MTNYFDSPFKGKLLSEQVKNPNIKVGRYSYYSGYYHGHSFDDCARYLFPDRDDVDKLIIGSFCSIGSGASFIMAGNQGHRYDWASSFRSQIAISMDGKGAWRDNVFVERLWRSIKYEEVYLHAYKTVSEARAGIARYLNFYNTRRPHWHCCKVSDEAAFCLIQRPYISKTLLTRRISPRGSP